jgi:DNA-binding MarR family transcriptional regulator
MSTFDELRLDVSWIRVYILLRARAQRISSADVATDLARRGFEFQRASVSGIMRGLERKGYLARIAIPNERRSGALYTLTERGRAAASGLPMKIREMLAGITPSGSSADSAGAD